ncbi:MAG: hypothetical protein RIQ60_1883 [Pseudomonadota bacterium]
MLLGELLDRARLKGLKIKSPFLEAEFSTNDQDADAAWELYVELLTRVTTQALPAEDGDEAAALASVHKLFDITRGILRAPGRRLAGNFAKLAIVVLNQKVRPFTARWHKKQLAGELAKDAPQRAATAAQFRVDLQALQADLRLYAGLLAEVARVEDLTTLEDD